MALCGGQVVDCERGAVPGDEPALGSVTKCQGVTILYAFQARYGREQVIAREESQHPERLQQLLLAAPAGACVPDDSSVCLLPRDRCFD